MDFSYFVEDIMNTIICKIHRKFFSIGQNLVKFEINEMIASFKPSVIKNVETFITFHAYKTKFLMNYIIFQHF